MALHLFIRMHFPRDIVITNDSSGIHILRIIFSMPILVATLNLDYRGSTVVAEFVVIVFPMRRKTLQALLRIITFWCLCPGGGLVKAKGFGKLCTVVMASFMTVELGSKRLIELRRNDMLRPDGFPSWDRAHNQGNAVLNNTGDKLLLDSSFKNEKRD